MKLPLRDRALSRRKDLLLPPLFVSSLFAHNLVAVIFILLSRTSFFFLSDPFLVCWLWQFSAFSSRFWILLFVGGEMLDSRESPFPLLPTVPEGVSPPPFFISLFFA